MANLPCMTCFKYHVYLYGSEAITYFNAILRVAAEPAAQHYQTPPPPPHDRQPSPSLYGSITFIHLEENSRMCKLSDLR
jgi:hypothetical protein